MSGPCINRCKQLWESDLLHGGDADDLQDFPERLRQVKPALGDGHKQIGTDRRPDLHPHAVEGSALETSQAQVLLDPAKEQLDGPTRAINLCDDQRRQVELVGDKDQHVAGLRVHKTDPAKLAGIVPLADIGVEFDGLIATQAGGFLDRPACRHVVRGVCLEAGDKEGPGAVQTMQSRKI